MKIFTPLLFVVLFKLSAAAAPPLTIKATVTEPHDKDALSVPAITVESGREALIQVHGIQCAVTPTLLDGGRVVLHFSVTHSDGKDTTPLLAPDVTTDLGKAAELQISGINFSIACTLPK